MLTMTTMVAPSFIAETQATVLLRENMAGVLSPTARSEPSFWSVVAQKAKQILLEDGVPPQTPDGTEMDQSPPKPSTPVKHQVALSRQNTPSRANMGRPIQKGLDAIASSLSLLGDTLGTAIEEGLHLMDSKPSGSPDQPKSLQRSPSIWRKVENVINSQQILKTDANLPGAGDAQLKASRDVAMAMASKAKLLLRELKTVKADMSFLKDRCSQLEEENRRLREGAHEEGDDLVRLQLETLLAEKQRLAQENANYARENQFLHEVVEYHQLTLQDVALLDESITGAAENYSTSSSDDEHQPMKH